MIRIFNSASFHMTGNERFISLRDVKIEQQDICEHSGKPYIFFSPEDYPLGAVYAEFDGATWQADMC